jgi:FKBP-type peptidyl-prolyl cis-trans isomerase (trigger factor)
MKKTPTPATDARTTPIGENTVLTLTIPKALHKPKYQDTLKKVASRMTVPGFRKGKAPLDLVESQMNPTAILNDVLEALIPDIYSDAVKKAKITPLVYPQVKIVSVEPDADWTVEAHTAVAPTITLGDWEKLVKKAGEEYRKEAKEHEKTHDADHPHEHDHDQELLSKIFGTLIEAINPKIPPLLLEQEVKHQIEDFAKQLASHKMELESYLKVTGKTVDTLQQDYTLSSLANLQVEFILRDITDLIKPEVTKQDINELIGKEADKYSKENLLRIQDEARSVILRRKTVEKLKQMAA